ncbi:MAG: hypothetical protein O3A53_20395 [Acidobacteria bacterium]|nr:hypothetical protein [Acidobacteriota bacterium]
MALRPNPDLLLWTVLVPLAYNVLIPYGILGDWQELAGFRALEYWPVLGMLPIFRLAAVRPKPVS